MVALAYDCHNHVHMGPTPLSEVIFPLRGMAIMSTQPSDYPIVASLASDSGDHIPAFGVHPWWLHELSDYDWETKDGLPRWGWALKQVLLEFPHAAVGETGLDGFHFDAITNKLTSPMEAQITAFRIHLEIAAELNRPVSIHCVRSFGPLLEVLSTLKRSRKLPRKVYFHAYGGKEGTVDQLVSICEEAYFGFAPVVNFRSPKTADVIRRVGLGRLVLESDHEDAKYVSESMESSIFFLATALDIDPEQVVDKTTENAIRLYSLDDRSPSL